MRVIGHALLLLPIALFSGCSDSPTALTPRNSAAPLDLLAPVVTVTNTDDAGPGSLRQAITDAPDGAVIRFDAAIAGQTIALTSGFMPIPKALTIEGPLPAGMTISGNLTSRIFRVEPDIAVVLRNLSIVNGRFTSGAGVLNEGTLTLDHVLLANNEATADGGGLLVAGAATQTTILNSTFSGNLARRGGGVATDRTVIIRNSTIVENTAGDGGGMFIISGNTTVRNSIIANNSDNDATNSLTRNCGKNLDVAVLLGTNLSSDESCGTGSTVIVGNPVLAPLASNGGPTKTHALNIGSPAIDAGTTCTEATDQRYVARPQGTTCDIGAFELDKFASVALTITPNVAVDGKTGTATVTGTMSCSAQGEIKVDLALSQTQKLNGRLTTLVQSAGTVTVNCAGTSFWSIALTPTTGGFEKGAATVTASTSGALGFLASTVTSTVKTSTLK